MVSDDAAVFGDEHIRVPQTPDTLPAALAEADADDHALLLCFCAQARDLRAVRVDALLDEAREVAFVVDWGGCRCEEGEAGDEGLGEGYECCSIAYGLVDVAQGFVSGGVGVEVDRRDVACGHSHFGRHCCLSRPGRACSSEEGET